MMQLLNSVRVARERSLRNECAFFDIFKFSLKERFRGQRQRKVDNKQIFFHIHSNLFILFFVLAASLSSWIFDISKMVYCLRRREVRRRRSECLAKGIYNQNKGTSILLLFPQISFLVSLYRRQDRYNYHHSHNHYHHLRQVIELSLSWLTSLFSLSFSRL